MALLTETELKNLWEAVRLSEHSLSNHSNTVFDCVQQYVGAGYGDKDRFGRIAPTPVNLIEMFIVTYMSHLTSLTPAAMITTEHAHLKPQAATFKLALNHLIKEIKLGRTLTAAAFHGMFGLSIVKVGLFLNSTTEINGVTHDVGQPYADHIPFEDFITDMTVGKRENCEFVGHEYLIALEDVQNSPLYDQNVVDELTSAEADIARTEQGADKLLTLGTEDASRPDEFRKRIKIKELWLPKKGLIVSIPVGKPHLLLHEAEWDGPENGPYHCLAFHPVPGNQIPKAPVAILKEMDETANGLLDKLTNQAKRQRDVLGYRGNAEEQAKRIAEAFDGDAINMDDPSATQEHKFGGIDQQTLAFFLAVKQLFSWQAGGLDTLAGLGPMTDTVGQEQLLAASASKRMSWMQDQIREFDAGIIRDLAWYLHTDPLIDLPLIKRVAGSDITIPVSYTAQQREGDFLDYNYKIEAHATQARAPLQR